MCLNAVKTYPRPRREEAAVQYPRSGKPIFVRWRVLRRDPETNRLTSLWVHSQKWMIGRWQRATCKKSTRLNLHFYSPDRTDHGFHVYLSEQTARQAVNFTPWRMVARVEVRGFIAGGRDNRTGLQSETWRECRPIEVL